MLMETKVIKLDASKPDVAKIKEAAAVVEAGGLVAFPTETVYGIACRAEADSLARLDELKGRAAEKYYTLHIGRKSDVEKYVPTIGLRVEKLIDKAWPGPLTIVFELDRADIDKQRSSIEKGVFEKLYKDNSIGIRCPDNSIASELLRRTNAPVVAPSANVAGQPPATSAEEVLAQFSGQIDLLLDGGACRYKKSSTVAKIGKEGLQILRAGVYSKQELESFWQVRFLLVCTGNTCRTPMAEGMFNKYLAEKLGCEVDWLEEIGYKATSAGTMGLAGLPASPEAVAACAARGVDIKAHKSTALSERLIRESDFIFVMSRMHRERIIALCGEVADRCVLLAEDRDIPDPIGQSQRVYDSCAELIEETVRKRISEFVI